ncbi:ABC transporter substrate-binding protein [Aureimonas sp. Leaf454]|uniref:ABC transporter substrate-binding protein n=1 Tax=Aureimonas sp. Leaf454 TaxID=1736381 RepID=UPI000AAC5EE9|nr:ABC transporter substrate-binding protein [Aureimonas sp. Leaf454]
MPGRLTRRALLGAAATAGLAPRAAIAQGAASAGEIRFAHAFGETVLPGPARRVVSLGFTTQDTLIALGTPPVALRSWFGDQPNGIWPWARPLAGDAAPVMIAGEVAMETVAALQPDLIVGIGSGISEAEYAILSQIAPTLMQAPGRAAYGTPFDELTATLGRALGRDAEAADLVARTKRLFAHARRRHPDWAGRTGVAAYHFGGETGAFSAHDTRGAFLAELGFAPRPEITRLAGDTFFTGLSPEDLSPLDGDLLLWISSFDAAPDLAALPMRKLLAAHQAGREVFAGALTAAALSFGSVLSLPFALSQLEGEIALALDGDPATPVPSAVTAGLSP